MNDYQMGVVEARFADIIWDNEPISSSELAKLSESVIGWKKSTTYTVLKRLCDKGIFQNNKGEVSSIVSKEEFYSLQTERIVNESFHGSLPSFLAAFTTRRDLTPDDVSELRRMLDEYEERK